jgi:nitroreductase
MKHVLLSVLVVWTVAGATWAQEPALKAIELVTPRKTGGMPIQEALAKRATSRAFDVKEIKTQQLSDLLWTAFGINRPDGKRTAPSAMDRREMEIYVLLKQGVFVYDAQKHRLDPKSGEDIRSLGGKQAFAKDAPVTLIFVADLSKMGDGNKTEKENTAAMDTGFISQNVYLFCASEGLATGVRGWVDRETLGKRLGLRPDQSITAAQSVGYPKP